VQAVPAAAARALRHRCLNAGPTSHSKLVVSKASTHATFTPHNDSLSFRECACKPLDDTVGAEMDVKELRRRQKSNQVIAKCIPVFLICVVVYASWVFVGPLCGE
jgi:hypothetical protein